jgi:glycosyltransferase involved in cell wall biosynthesis
VECDYILDCSHEHVAAQEMKYYEPEHKWKTVLVYNGCVTHVPRCKAWNVVVGSKKWKQLMLEGHTQFIDTPHEAQYGREITPFKAEQFAPMIISWAINTKFYCPSDYSKDEYLLWFSRPTPYKGLHRAISFCEQLGFPLKIAMPMEQHEHKFFGEQYTQSIEEAKAKGAKIIIHKLPANSTHHEAKRELYRRARALIFSIEAHECWGLTVAESLSCGTPVIASNLGAMPELIKHGKTGYLCNTDSGFKEAIGWIQEGMIDPRECVKDARRRFDRSVAARRYIKLYDKLKERKEGQDGQDSKA